MKQNKPEEEPYQEKGSIEWDIHKLLKVIQCEICMEQYDSVNKKAKYMPCGHIICLQCIEKWRSTNDQNENVKCATCDQKFKYETIKQLAPVFMLQQTERDF